jgi:hypothetical protein
MRGQGLVQILARLAVAAVGELADEPAEELAAAGAFAAVLLGLGGDADGREFVAIAIEPAGEAQTEGAGVELVGLALAIEGDGRNEKGLGAGGDQFAVQRKAEAATLLDGEDLITFGDPLSDLGDELGGG